MTSLSVSAQMTVTMVPGCGPSDNRQSSLQPSSQQPSNQQLAGNENDYKLPPVPLDIQNQMKEQNKERYPVTLNPELLGGSQII